MSDNYQRYKEVDPITEGTEIPEDGLCTGDLDCVLFNTNPPTYRGGIVALGAVEMNLKSKTWTMDIVSKRTQYYPWYFMKLNPKMCIPTMLAKGNVPVPESVNINEYMDKELSQGNLMANQPEWVKERYEQFKQMHEEFDVEGFSYEHMFGIWYFRQIGLLRFLGGTEHTIKILKENKFPEQREILIDKLFANDTFLDMYLTRPARGNKARE